MEHSKLDLLINNIKSSEDQINNVIIQYTPFIIKTVSNLKRSYVSVENDDEFSIGLIAFNEAIEKYDLERGAFLPFAKLIIESRIKNEWKRNEKHQHDDIDHQNIISNDDLDLKFEIDQYELELQKFGLDFEILISLQPKHKDTRERAKHIGKLISSNKKIMNLTYDKRRLPVTLVSRTFNFSLKIVKKSKLYILATSIVFYKKYEYIMNWIK